jgi:hypothetical protein
MNETGTAVRAWMNPTEAEQKAETQIRRPSFRLISGLEKTDVGGIRMAQYLEMIANADGEDEGTVGRSKSEWVSARITMV